MRIFGHGKKRCWCSMLSRKLRKIPWYARPDLCVYEERGDDLVCKKCGWGASISARVRHGRLNGRSKEVVV